MVIMFSIQETHKNQAFTLYYEQDFLTRRLEEMKLRTAEEIQVSRIISELQF